MKIDKADQAFSWYIRSRDRKCMRCSSPVLFNDKGLPVSHHNSHYFGRGRENTRYDPSNCICLCHGCHQHWGSADKEGYRNFMIKWLGEKGFEMLSIRAETYAKKDRKMAYIVAKELLKTLKV